MLGLLVRAVGGLGLLDLSQADSRLTAMYENNLQATSKMTGALDNLTRIAHGLPESLAMFRY